MIRFKRNVIAITAEMLSTYGSNIHEMTTGEARAIYLEAERALAEDYKFLRSFLCEVSIEEENYKQKLVDRLMTITQHLLKGQSIGLDLIEQNLVDMLCGRCPHDYSETDVMIARMIAKELKTRLVADHCQRCEGNASVFTSHLMWWVNDLLDSRGLRWYSGKRYGGYIGMESYIMWLYMSLTGEKIKN